MEDAISGTNRRKTLRDAANIMQESQFSMMEKSTGAAVHRRKYSTLMPL